MRARLLAGCLLLLSACEPSPERVEELRQRAAIADLQVGTYQRELDALASTGTAPPYDSVRTLLDQARTEASAAHEDLDRASR